MRGFDYVSGCEERCITNFINILLLIIIIIIINILLITTTNLTVWLC